MVFRHVDLCWHVSVHINFSDYSLAWGLHFHSRCGDFNLVSRSQVCQKDQMQIVRFTFLSTVI